MGLSAICTKLGPDNQFSVEELIKIMLNQSDNTAANAIFNIFSKIGVQDPLSDIYSDLGWEIMPPSSPVKNRPTQII